MKSASCIAHRASRILRAAFRRSAAWAGFVLILLPAGISVSRLGSILHESDQASVLLGALRLARGTAAWIHPGFYEYGHYFLSYWLLSGVFRLFPKMDPVLLGNAVNLAVFWLGAGVLLFSVRKKLSPGRCAAVFSALAAPAVLVHLPYLAPNFLAAGLLFAGAGLLNVSRRLFPASVLLWAMACGCRMDALLLIPLLAWLSAERASLRGLVFSARSWILAGSGLLVFLAGRALDGFAPSLGYAPFFMPNVYFAFLLFGAGSALVLSLVLGITLVQEGRVQSGADARLFWWAAVPALFLPFVFYSAFMFSTRHWMVFIAGLLMAVCSDRTENSWRTSRVRGPLLLFSALIPLAAGLHLPFVSRPSVTLREPTLFPTTDGRCPMGAVVPFLFSPQRLDHNQKTWAAAREVRHWEEFEGTVPLGSFQLFEIVRLAVFLNGQQTNDRGADLSQSPFFYISSRALLKPEVRMDAGKIIEFQIPAEGFALQEIAGRFPVCIVRLSAAGPDRPRSDLEQRILFLRSIFQGDEVDWLGSVPAGALLLPGIYEGHPLLLFSETPFDLTTGDSVRRPDYMPLPDSTRGFFYVYIPLFRHGEGPVSVSHPVRGCSTVYPGYMSLKNL